VVRKKTLDGKKPQVRIVKGTYHLERGNSKIVPIPPYFAFNPKKNAQRDKLGKEFITPRSGLLPRKKRIKEENLKRKADAFRVIGVLEATC